MKLIDADELEEKMLEYEITIKRIRKNRISNKEQAILLDIGILLGDAPTIDAVPVVRCKDCKWYGDIGCAISVVDDSDKPTENDFCSFGERKDDSN